MHAQGTRRYRFTVTLCSTAILVCCATTSPTHAAGLVAAWGDNSYGQTRLPHGVSGIIAISAGTDHSLALKSDGTVLAWGYPQYTNVPPQATNVVAVSAGGRHSLALRNDGTVLAWGNSLFNLTTVPPGLSNVVSIGAGDGHNMALLSNGTVVTWGNNYSAKDWLPAGLSNIVAISAGAYHSLALKADGTIAAAGVFVDGGAVTVPAGLSNVVAISAGRSHSLGLKGDGTVVAWGNPRFPAVTNVPAGLSNVVAIAAGGASSLALKSDGTVVGWGGPPIPPGLSNVSAIAAGHGHFLALVPNGPVQLAPLQPLAVPYTSNATFTISASGKGPFQYQWMRRRPAYLDLEAIKNATNSSLTFTNARFTDMGTYAVLVSNVFGSVFSSMADLTVVSPPFISGQPENQTRVVGEDITFYALTDGTPPLSFQWQFNCTNIPGATWSSLTITNVQFAHSGRYSLVVTNAYGVARSDEALFTVVDGPPRIRRHPASQTSVIHGTANFSAWASGSLPMTFQWRFDGRDIPGATNSTLALESLRYDQSGYYAVAVKNEFGETVSSKARLDVRQVALWPNLSTLHTNYPPGLTNAVALSAGDAHIMALKADGTVAVWLTGYPYGKSTVTNVPAELNRVVAIAAGADFCLALKSNGTVTAWGTLSNVPPWLSNVVSIAAGRRHAVAARANGTVVAWAPPNSSSGGPYSLLEVPPGLSNVTAVAAGSYHSLALRRDGSVVGWGRNDYRQSSPPSSATNAIAIAASRDLSAALRADGTVVFWGAYPPPARPEISNVVAIAIEGGYSRVLALRADGNVAVWGTSARLETNVPPGISNVIAVASGGYPSFFAAALGDGKPVITIHPVPQAAALGETVQFHARAVGVQPMSYQWQFNGRDIPGETAPDLLLSSVQLTNFGSYRMIASNALGTVITRFATLTNTVPEPPVQLPATNVQWHPPLYGPLWFSQGRESHDGAYAYQSGPTAHSKESLMQTELEGPGTLTFWWKVSSERDFDFLTFTLNGARKASISGETEWQQQTFELPAGKHVLRWVYSKDATVSNGEDAGWLDEVTFIYPPPTIIGPPDRTSFMGEQVLLKAQASGGFPLTYQWTKDGLAISNARSANLSLPKVTRRDSGHYAVIVSHLGGKFASSNVTLTVRVPQALASPQRDPDGTIRLIFRDADGGALLLNDLAGLEVQTSTNLLHWLPLSANLVLTNGSALLLDTSHTNDAARFYRVLER